MVRGNRVKEYNFTVGSLTANAAGKFSVYTSHPLNGVLKGCVIYENNYDPDTGSLFLAVSGIESVAWSMVSGTARGTGVNTSGLTLPLATTVRTNATPISGGNGYVAFAEIPMNSIMHLTGSKMGASKSGLGFAIAYI